LSADFDFFHGFVEECFVDILASCSPLLTAGTIDNGAFNCLFSVCSATLGFSSQFLLVVDFNFFHGATFIVVEHFVGLLAICH